MQSSVVPAAMMAVMRLLLWFELKGLFILKDFKVQQYVLHQLQESQPFGLQKENNNISVVIFFPNTKRLRFLQLM